MDELSEEDKLTVSRARKIQRFLIAAVPRRRGVHRHPRQVRADRRHGPLVQGGRRTANTTTFPKPPSTWSAASKRRSPRPRSWRRKPKPDGRPPPSRGLRQRRCPWSGEPVSADSLTLYKEASASVHRLRATSQRVRPRLKFRMMADLKSTVPDAASCRRGLHGRDRHRCDRSFATLVTRRDRHASCRDDGLHGRRPAASRSARVSASPRAGASRRTP